MTTYDFNIGARVHCKDGDCGKLRKVVIDPHTQRVTDLVITSGFVLTTDRVLPIAVVTRAVGEDITLSISSETLEEYPEYREVEFTQPAPGAEEGAYQRDDVRCWQSKYRMVCSDPVIPMIHKQVHKGVSPNKTIIARGTPVLNQQENLGQVDHVLVDPDSGEITHIVIRKGLLPYYPILHISKVKSVNNQAVHVELTEEAVRILPRYRSRDAEDIKTELRDSLQLSSHDFRAVKIRVEGSIVTLTGQVADMQAKRRAEALAYGTPGVVGVENQLATNISTATHVQQALLSDSRTEVAAINVLNKGGIITLKGKVDSPAIREVAEEIAAAQPGVVSIINDLKVESDEDTDLLKARLMAITTSRTQ